MQFVATVSAFSRTRINFLYNYNLTKIEVQGVQIKLPLKFYINISTTAGF